MERIKGLGRYPKVILLLLTVMLLLFTVLYIVTLTRVGISYKDAILVPSQGNGKTEYSGKIHGQKAVFTVTEDKVVEFHYGDKVYGPYTAKRDKTALPDDWVTSSGEEGVELRRGEEIVFRGSVKIIKGHWFLTNEDGSSASSQILTEDRDGNLRDEHGNIVDMMEPSAGTILHLMDGPELTHKGQWRGWLYGLLACFMTALLILFADELFYLRVSRWVNNPDSAEPSDWEITRRYIIYTVLSILSLVIFIRGLR